MCNGGNLLTNNKNIAEIQGCEPVKTLPNFPQNYAYTQIISPSALWDDFQAWFVRPIYFSENNYAFVGMENTQTWNQFCSQFNLMMSGVEQLDQQEPICTNKEIINIFTARFLQDQMLPGKEYYPTLYPDEAFLERYGSTEGLGARAWNNDPTLTEEEDKEFSWHRDTLGENVYKDHVYNIEVADYHTYFVGYDGIWVHNANCGGVALVSHQEGDKLSDYVERINIKDPANESLQW